MEALTRMVADSLARHGLDRPIDPRRLQWSRWFRCDSTHSLLTVPSKPGIFALAEEVMNLAPTETHGGTDAFVRPAEQSSATACTTATAEATDRDRHDREGHDFSRATSSCHSERSKIDRKADDLAESRNLLSARATTAHGGTDAPLAAEGSVRRMLSVLQFAEDDDMAFVLDRMFTRINPMRDRLASGRCFLRFVVIEDQAQRRSICSVLNQWMLSSAEKASGLPPDFSSSLEFTRAPEATRVAEPTRVGAGDSPAHSTGAKTNVVSIARNLDSGAAKNLHCSQPLPSGF
jgi:hypothetical protein